jgi:hypothetical protein
MKYTDLIKQPVNEADDIDAALEENLSQTSRTAPTFFKQQKKKQNNTAKLKRWTKDIDTGH